MAIRPAAWQRAQHFRTLGLSVIPVPRPGRGCDGKVPVIEWKAFQSRLPTLDELQQWFAVEMNIAIITGAVSGVVVIDADTTEAMQWIVRTLPPTPWQVKTAKGVHCYYRHPGSPVRNRVRLDTGEGTLAIDVRADGGFVIAPGSRHASGCTYQALGDWTQPRERLPVFSPSWLARPAFVLHGERAPFVATSQPTPFLRTSLHVDVQVRARAYLAKIPVPVIGQGSDRAVFYAACRLVRRFALSDADAEQLLWDWCGNRDGWTREWVQQKIHNAHTHGTEPVGV